MRQIVENLRANRKVGILIDQKYNEGIVASFFGKPATSSTAFAQLGQKIGCPVYPQQVIRTGGAHFTVVIYPALSLLGKTLEQATQDANDMLEIWMRGNPDQWLWVHRRWSSKAVQDTAKNDSVDDSETIDEG
jgi:KDO2-lipid IV(A) lauroyltransferase